MNEQTNSVSEPKPKKTQLYKCTVIVPKITVGPIVAGRGAVLELSKEDADALAALNPPAIKIDGI